MLRKFLSLLILSVFILSSAGVYADQATSQPTAPAPEKTKDRASRAMNNLLYGPTEVPGNLNQTATKGTKMERGSEKTRTGVERGIGRFVAGVWQLATFWYSDPGAVTSASQAAASAATK